MCNFRLSAQESGGQSQKLLMDTRQRLLSRSQAHSAAANSSSSSNNNNNNGNIPDQPNGNQLAGGSGVGQYPELNDDADSSDMLNSSSLADSELMSRRRLVNGVGDSDVDNGGPLDDGDDLELTYRMRRQSRRQRLLQRRRDSSLAATGAEADTVCSGGRRHREGSLSRGYRRAATTDDRSSQPPLPSGLSRSSTRVGQPLRSASIPPPPSEPPPSTPGMSPMLFDSNTGQNNPYAFYPLMNLNMMQQQLPYTAALQPTYIDQAGGCYFCPVLFERPYKASLPKFGLIKLEGVAGSRRMSRDQRVSVLPPHCFRMFSRPRAE
ncbi:unnamed protein product [Schistocephalus solidus]|uniref:Protein dimmed n=1 Tax=Schistocephalus solidus TaxID=70667 RepID=A0A183SJ53_SCHSO|nr:unnamed protein product [Schistocephalus solidus]